MAKTIIEKNVQIRGTITKLFANCPKPSGWFAGMVKTKNLGDICVSGTCPNMVSKGVIIECTADLVDSNYGQQYEAQSVSIVTDSTGAVLAYLSGPSFPHIGRITASKLVNKYGKKVLNLIVDDPQRVMTECNLSESQMKVLQTGVANQSIENQLQKKFPHLGATWVRTIVKTSAFGNSYQSIETAILKNPYCLMNVEGLTFKKADEVATQDLGLTWDDFRRVNCVFDNAMKDFMQSTGGTYVNLMDVSDTYQLRQYLSQHLGVAVDDMFVKNAMMRQVKKNVYYLEQYNSETHLYVKKMKEIETSILDECLYHLQGGGNPIDYQALSSVRMSVIKDWVQKQKADNIFDLNTDQENALYTVIENSLSCVTGGPGRGKTHLMKVLAQGWNVVTKGGLVLMLAPTGKAVNRIKNETGWLEAETIARCVLMNRKKSSKQFACSAVTGKEIIPLNDSTLVLVDEASMIDFEEGEELLRLFHDCHIVLVGDMYQLPPIEPGAFFTEIIRSKVIPVAHLKKNMRTKSREISDNADKILSGDTHMTVTSNFMMLPCDDEAAVDLAINSYQNLLANGETSSDIMLMAPVNRGVASVSDVNRRLQNILNPENNKSHHVIDVHRALQYEDTKGWTIPNVKCNDMTFRIYDRVMNTKNHADYAWKKYKDDDIDGAVVDHGTGLFNGDTGTIIRYYYADDMDDSPDIVVKMDDGRVFFVPIEEFNEFVIGYCVTIHKAQGSEARNVILLLSSSLNSPFFERSFLNQNLLNTAVTRAKENVMIVGNMNAFKTCVVHPYKYHNSVLGVYINYNSIPILAKQNMALLAKSVQSHVNFPKTWMKHVFTEKEKANLLAGQEIFVTDCLSKTGKPFSCKLFYDDDGTGNYRVMSKFES